MWLGKQGLAFRGHFEHEQSLNKGNFLELCDFKAEYVPSLQSFLTRQFNYTHHDIQNELAHLIANQIRQSNLPKSIDYWAIIADETSDNGNIEQVTFVLRFVDHNLVINERFFGFWAVPDVKSLTLFNIIKTIVADLGLNKNNLVATGFDGANNMSGKKAGLCTLIKENMSAKSIYVHCYCHRLNLALESACKKIQDIEESIETARTLYAYVEGSAKRHHLFQHVQGEATKTTLKELCATRWHHRYAAFKAIKQTYTSLITFLSIQNDDLITKCGATASGLLKKI